MLSKLSKQALIESSDAVIVELGGNGAEYRHSIWRLVKGTAVALYLFGHIPECIFRSFAIKFIDGKHIGIIQHVDLFQLAGSTEFGSHHVQRSIHEGHNAGVPLADARRLYDNEIES